MSKVYVPKPMATVEEVKDLILRACPGADLSTIREERQFVTGEVRWDGFEGWDDDRRFGHLAQHVRGPLAWRGMNIGALYPLTPSESLDD